MKKNRQKSTQLFCLFCFLTAGSIAQNYTWMKGSNSYDEASTYGTLGTPASLNNPGERVGAVSWKDATANFWLFGGFGYDSQGNDDYMNDLWKYTLSTNEWTWINGDTIVY